MKKSIKIFVTYKEKHPILKSDIFTPIQTGRAIADEVFRGMLGDDTGDNVSKDNPKYNELSAQYWVWKNYEQVGNPEYVGFVHYRRHFIFDAPNDLPSRQPWMPGSAVYRFDVLDEEYKKMMLDQDIEYTCSKYDCITLKPYDVKLLGVKSIRDQFESLPEQCVENFDLFIETLYEKAPSYKNEIDELLATDIQYLCNMFIMKRELFFEYSSFAFSILKALDEKIESDHYSEKGLRYLGFFGEMLLGIFVKHIKKQGKKVKELDGSIILYNDIVEKPKPVFADSPFALTTYISENDVPLFSVCLASILTNMHKNRSYDLVVMERNLREESKQSLLSMCGSSSNISLRFFNVKQYFVKSESSLKEVRERCHKLSAPEIFSYYEKIIYVEWNYIFQADVADLFDLNLDGKIIAACKDVNMNGFIGSKKSVWKDYCSATLSLNNIYNFINTGLMLIDTKRFIEEDIAYKCYTFILHRTLRKDEQDSLNNVLQNKILFLPIEWGIPTLYRDKCTDSLYTMEYDIQRAYRSHLRKPKGVHYVSPNNPWTTPNAPLAQIWWKYSRETPFYEEALQRLIAHMVTNGEVFSKDGVLQLRKEFAEIHLPNINRGFSSNEYKTKLLYALSHMWYFRFMKLRYAICKAFSFGKKNSKYAFKYEASKKLLKDARRFRKQMKTL